MSNTWALLPAAGSGSRMHSPVKKQFLPLLGKPILARTLAVFASHPMIDRIAIVTGAGDREAVQDIAKDFPKVRLIAEGGATRQDSVYEGLKAIRADCELVAIHDAARPLVSESLITACIEAARKNGCAIAATPVRDTVKRTDSAGFVIETPKRENLWNVQTPQVFFCGEILRAHQAAREAGEHGCTDDGAVMERFGARPVLLIPGSSQNIKITTPEDIFLAELYLEAMQ